MSEFHDSGDGPLAPSTPGDVLADFLPDYGLTPEELQERLGNPMPSVPAICAGEAGITSTVAALLSDYFGTSEELWTNLQRNHDARV